MKCENCKYWQPGIPCGVCLHPNGETQGTTDKMVFIDASEYCPISKEREING